MNKGKLILRYLLLKIQSNQFSVGDKINSEGDLIIKFKCNRNTVAKVLNKLKLKKIIINKPGIGNFLNKSFYEYSNIKSYVDFDKYIISNLNYKKIPLKIMGSISYKENSKKSHVKHFLNNIHIASQYLFYSNELGEDLVNKINFRNLYETLSYFGVVIQDVEQKIFIINNKESEFGIKDQKLIVIKSTLFSDDDKIVITIYKIISEKYLSAKNRFLTLNTRLF